jgi:EmrB/QacA subfamily drug resistance transporter
MVALLRPPCETPEAQKPSAAVPATTRWILPTTILGSSMGFIDSSVVNVALPVMQQDLQTTFGTMQWVVNGYLLALASLILLGGSAGDRFGRRRVFMLGLAGFAAASVACGLAPSASWLIAARLLQGVAAALLTPTSLAIIGAAYSGDARGPAIGTWAAAGALTTALGPPIGGWLIDEVGWRAIFFINLPIAAVALLLATKLPADRGIEDCAPLDQRGAVLAVLSLGFLSYGLIALGEGSQLVAALAIGATVPTAWLFIQTEARAQAPMMPLSLFRNANFSGANALTVLLYAALSGPLFLLPFLLIDVQGYSATAAGAAFLPFAVIMGLGSRWSGGLVDSFGPRPPLIVGPLIAAAGYAVLGISEAGTSYWTSVLPGLIAVSIGMTISVAPLTTTVFDSSPKEESGTASGINNAAARTGSLLAVAALGLAFGGSGQGTIKSDVVANAYTLVMFTASALAALSAFVAALTISRS